MAAAVRGRVVKVNWFKTDASLKKSEDKDSKPVKPLVKGKNFKEFNGGIKKKSDEHNN